jgi:hypothetical protein
VSMAEVCVGSGSLTAPSCSNGLVGMGASEIRMFWAGPSTATGNRNSPSHTAVLGFRDDPQSSLFVQMLVLDPDLGER